MINRPLVFEMDEELELEIRARSAVLHAGREYLKALTDADPSTLPGRKAVTDLLVAARSLPRHLTTADSAVERLSTEWDTDLHRLLQYETRDDGDRVQRVRTHLEGLRKALSNDPFPGAIDRLVESVIAVCRLAYLSAWTDPIVVFETSQADPGRVSSNAPGASSSLAADTYALTAKTLRTLEGSTVLVQFWLKEFGPATYAALPRLLMHECFCHAVAAHPLDEADQSSPFAEGFMDWAADYFFREVFLPRDELLWESAEHHGDKLSDALKRRGDDGGARTAGEDNARRLVRWLGNLGMSHAEATRSTAQLAIEVNLVEESLRVKDTFVSALGNLPVFPADESTWLTSGLRRWIRDKATAYELLEATTREVFREWR